MRTSRPGLAQSQRLRSENQPLRAGLRRAKGAGRGPRLLVRLDHDPDPTVEDQVGRAAVVALADDHLARLALAAEAPDAGLAHQELAEALGAGLVVVEGVAVEHPVEGGHGQDLLDIGVGVLEGLALADPLGVAVGGVAEVSEGQLVEPIVEALALVGRNAQLRAELLESRPLLGRQAALGALAQLLEVTANRQQLTKVLEARAPLFGQSLLRRLLQLALLAEVQEADSRHVEGVSLLRKQGALGLVSPLEEARPEEDRLGLGAQGRLGPGAERLDLALLGLVFLQGLQTRTICVAQGQ